MTIPTTDPPVAPQAVRLSDQPGDRDERRIRVIVDAIRKADRAGTETEHEARSAAVRALLDYGEIAVDQPEAAGPR